MKTYKAAMMTMLFLFPLWDAEAASIVNLSKEPQALVIEQFRQRQEIIISPGGRYETLVYPTRVIRGDFTLALEQYGEYAIWPDGAIALQKRDRAVRGRHF